MKPLEDFLENFWSAPNLPVHCASLNTHNQVYDVVEKESPSIQKISFLSVHFPLTYPKADNLWVAIAWKILDSPYSADGPRARDLHSLVQCCPLLCEIGPASRGTLQRSSLHNFPARSHNNSFLLEMCRPGQVNGRGRQVSIFYCKRKYNYTYCSEVHDKPEIKPKNFRVSEFLFVMGGLATFGRRLRENIQQC